MPVDPLPVDPLPVDPLPVDPLPATGRRRRSVKSLAKGLTLALAAVLVLPATPLPASAASVNTIPVRSDGRIRVVGHGFGHAIGLSQWGALGAARKGLTPTQILDHYYPGTVRGTAPNGVLRVWIEADNNILSVRPASGLKATVGGRTVTLPTRVSSRTPNLWSVRRAANGRFRLTYRGVYSTGEAKWFTYPIGGALEHRGEILFSRPTRDLRLLLPSGNVVRMRAFLRGAAVGSGSGMKTIAHIRLEDYLRSVVTAEMPASWDSAALQAQAVAARTYALRSAVDRRGRGGYDVCSSTYCQVFKGTALYSNSGRLIASYEHPRVDAAVRAVASRVRRERGGRYALTMFSASNGGWSIDGGLPYLPAKRDPYDGAVPNSAHTWYASARASTLQSRWPSIGTLRRVVVTERDGRGDWGGRVRVVRVEGSKGSVRVTGATFRRAVGWRTTWFANRP